MALRLTFPWTLSLVGSTATLVSRRNPWRPAPLETLLSTAKSGETWDPDRWWPLSWPTSYLAYLTPRFFDSPPLLIEAFSRRDAAPDANLAIAACLEMTLARASAPSVRRKGREDDGRASFDVLRRGSLASPRLAWCLFLLQSIPRSSPSSAPSGSALCS